MISAWIPSRNRACQLELLIESIYKNAPNMFVFTVLYRADNTEFQAGYDLFQKRHPWVGLVKENDFQNQFKAFVELCAVVGDPLALFTDDCVCYRQFDQNAEDVQNALLCPNLWCVSFRLGLNTDLQNYLTGERQPKLEKRDVFQLGKFISWKWKNRDPNSNRGYGLSWDGHVYRGRDLLSLANSFSFKNPREFEASVQHRRHNITYEWMAAPQTNNVVVNTINEVQGDGVVPAGIIYSYSPRELNERYLAWEVINVDDLCKKLEGFDGCHTEAPLTFRKG